MPSYAWTTPRETAGPHKTYCTLTNRGRGEQEERERRMLTNHELLLHELNQLHLKQDRRHCYDFILCELITTIASIITNPCTESMHVLLFLNRTRSSLKSHGSDHLCLVIRIKEKC